MTFKVKNAVGWVAAHPFNLACQEIRLKLQNQSPWESAKLGPFHKRTPYIRKVLDSLRRN